MCVEGPETRPSIGPSNGSVPHRRPALRPTRVSLARVLAGAALALALAACHRHDGTDRALTAEETAVVDSILADSLPPRVDPYGIPMDTLDRRQYIRWLEAGQFDTLEAIFEERRQAIIADIQHEARMYNLLEAFFQSNPTIEPALLAWVAARPESPHPMVAMAYYRLGRAVDARGGGLAGSTGEERFFHMREQARRGQRAAVEALQRGPDHFGAHFAALSLMRYGAAEQEPEWARATLQTALQTFPASYYLRNELMSMMSPMWGGSLDIMQALAEDTKQHFNTNPRLRPLAGAVARAERSAAHEDTAMAMALLDQAAFFGEDYFQALAWADQYLTQSRWVDALRAAQRASKHMPQGRTMLEVRAKLLQRIGAMIADSAVRERAFNAAERDFLTLRELRVPDANVALSMRNLAAARAACRRYAPPCLED